MCDNCLKILGKCVAPHYKYPEKCPLKTASYCCLCASYGHSVRQCKSDQTYRAPQFLEQLIPPSLLELNNITTNTPISGKHSMPLPMIPTIDVIDHPKVIKAILKSKNDVPKIEDRDKNKYKKHLAKIGKAKGENVVFHKIEKQK